MYVKNSSVLKVKIVFAMYNMCDIHAIYCLQGRDRFILILRSTSVWKMRYASEISDPTIGTWGHRVDRLVER